MSSSNKSLFSTLKSSTPSWQSRLQFIYQSTKQHALNLAKFVTIYKILLLIQRKSNGGKERKLDTFVAGLLGGYFTFGDRNPVNEQVGYEDSVREGWAYLIYRLFFMLRPGLWHLLSRELVLHTTQLVSRRWLGPPSSPFRPTPNISPSTLH